MKVSEAVNLFLDYHKLYSPKKIRSGLIAAALILLPS
jgi:hypothetical protein